MLGGVLALAACGIPGAPQPPSLEVPKPVDDLSATRKGDHVLLTWTPPTQITDGENIRRVGTTDVCRGANDFPMVRCDDKLALLTDAQVAHWTKTTLATRKDYDDVLPESLQLQNPLANATYALNDLNRSGHSAGLSNQVLVPLAPTLSPPGGLETRVTPDGVLLSWTATAPPLANAALNYLYRVFRKEGNGDKPEVIAGEVPATDSSFLDRNFDWEQRYTYRIAGITQVQRAGKEQIEVEGDDSPLVEAFTHDVFPPAIPTDLQAVYSGVGQKPFIDLTWAPNLEGDLAGYNVYRHEAGTAPVKINSEVVKTPSYRDPNVASGQQYFYAVSGVDVHGNESGKSEETSERVPE